MDSDSDIGAIMERAKTLMRDTNCNCSETVVKVLADRFEYDPGLSKLATVFGGGVSRNADLCGFLTGGLMAISINLGRTEISDRRQKAICYEAGNEYYTWFMETFGRCNDIVGDPRKGPHPECLDVGDRVVPYLVDLIERFRSK